jgi:7,8-dihydroneopterin aldolase/epimerase/oxygenase
VDRIRLEGMVFSGRHGVSDAERSRSQLFTVDVEAEAELDRAGETDRIEDTVDYRALHSIAREVITGEPAHLIEALANRIAERSLEIPGVKSISVRVAKRPPRLQPLDAAAVEIKRTRG